MRLSEKLALLGGAELAILKRVPTAVGQYVQFALVLLGTALMASVSMWFALVQGLKVNVFLAVPFAVLWGLLILNLDRYLTSNMQSSPSFKQALGMAIPRLAMAALIGVVISTPLVLKVFESDISAQMAHYNIQRSDQSAEPLNASAFQQNVDRLQAEVARLRQVQAGNNGAANSPAVDAAKQRVAELEMSVSQQTKIADEAQKLYICERYGTGRDTLADPNKCSPTPGPYGPFPQIEADFNNQKKILQDLEGQLQQARDTLSRDVSTSAGQQAGALKSAQDQAAQQLPLEESQLASARAKLAQMQEQVATATLNDQGILAQLRALFALGDSNPFMNAAHWTVGALFFMIELLPVMVKLMMSSGPPSLYEQVKKLDEQSLVDEAKVRRNADRRRIEEESKKRRDVEDDMRSREKQLGIKANLHVASGMEKILEAALEQWSRDVSATLNSHSAPHGPSTAVWAAPGATPVVGPSNGMPVSVPRVAGSAPAANGADPGKNGVNVLKKFNIPGGDNL